ncbi:GroES-like protein [Mycena indigotica]|uniref:GroES-like protein n=1 Tax=Mycena indigotica TaxID=2126181 RepID=A0A8H6VVJ7_9AGAR|nr:GroES-like protein [Mycena indigotica]KAF7293491.1 GroES-like protein [Mycena indigotica]
MSTPTQTAVVIETPKAPFIVKSGIAIPKPAAGQVLLQVMAVGLNPMDPMRRSMDMLIDSYPAILGSDIAGVIEEVGQGVQGWKKGDEVFCSDTAGLVDDLSSFSFRNLQMSVSTSSPLITGCTSLNGLYTPSPIGLGFNPIFSSDKPQSGNTVVKEDTVLLNSTIKTLRTHCFEREAKVSSLQAKMTVVTEERETALELLGETELEVSRAKRQAAELRRKLLEAESELASTKVRAEDLIGQLRALINAVDNGLEEEERSDFPALTQSSDL